MLNDFNIEHFLCNYWQKKPLFIKSALKDIPNFIEPNELAGLALEDEVESRVIQNTNENWQLEHGPFDEEYFAQLPESHWTLLIQTLEHWLPEVNPFLQNFNFIPSWRFDDLMVSFATDKGGVGPHYDNYDVFLVQSSGKRHWRVGAKGDTQNQTTKINGLKHIDHFEPIIDVVMEPGDILYIPPETPHWGVSLGHSMGYSVGYRSLQNSELIGLIADHFDSELNTEFFADPYRAKSNEHNQIEPEFITWAQQKIKNIANNQELISTILSKHLSQSKLELSNFSLKQPIENLHGIKTIQLKNTQLANWFELEKALVLSINGETYYCSNALKPFIKELLAGKTINLAGLQKEIQKFDFYQTLTNLINEGLILVKK